MSDRRSHTVRQAYATDRSWWLENGGLDGIGHDRDGYDEDGWNAEGRDRAGLAFNDHDAERPTGNDLIEAASIRLRERISNRVPRTEAKRLLAAVGELLVSRFPEAEDPRDGTPRLVDGINSGGDLYLGIYWDGDAERADYFAVVADGARLPDRSRPGVSVFVSDATSSEVREHRESAGEEAALLDRVAALLDGFEPGRLPDRAPTP